MNILLVEDNILDARVIEEAIHRSGHGTVVHRVQDGEEALDYLRQAPTGDRPDLILLDLSLPKIDGYGFLQQMKAMGKWDSVPVIVLTASNAGGDILRTYHLGVNSFITKPADVEQFMKTVQAVEHYWLLHAESGMRG